MYNPQLKTFFVAVETGSFSKAAAHLYLTPSAVLHQIRSLEKDLGAELFYRTSKGVSLTPAGEYLLEQGRTFARMGDEIRSRIRFAGAEAHTVWIGTSMLEKCRLLYDLWVLFSAVEKDCSIQMTNIDVAHNIPASTDLIESLNSNTPWMQRWEFLEICRVPFGFAFANDHPLAKKSVITLQDLQGMTVYTINDGSCETIAEILHLLRENGIQVVFRYGDGMNMFWEPAFTRQAQLVPLCFQDILIGMTVVPFEKEYVLPYGIFHRPSPTPTARKFLDFIEHTYNGDNPDGIVPVLG